MTNLPEGMQIDKTTKANILIDMSKFDLFLTCEYRYFIRHILKKERPIIFKAKALDYGGLLHEGYEAYYKALAQGVTFADRVELAQAKIRAISSDPRASNTDPDEVRRLLNVIEENLDYWRHEDEYLEILGVEEPFTYVLYEDDYVRILMSGKIDLRVNKPSLAGSGSYTNLPIDHKTFQRDFPLQSLANQFQNYCVATGSPYLFVNRVGLQKTVAPNEKYKRVPLSYDKEKLSKWKDNTTKIILGKYLSCITDQEWPRNYTNCTKFNRICEYYEVCDSSGEAAAQQKLESNYVDAPEWDVTNKMGKSDE